MGRTVEGGTKFICDCVGRREFYVTVDRWLHHGRSEKTRDATLPAGGHPLTKLTYVRQVLYRPKLIDT